MSDIDDFLEEQKSQGRLESAGGFSVDWVRAEALMSKNLLEDPDQWILKIVQTLVREAPEEIDICHQADRLNFYWKPSIATQQTDFSSLFSAAALKHLKVGLAAYSGFGGSSIQYCDPLGKAETLLGPGSAGTSIKPRVQWNCLSFKQLHKKGWFGLGSFPSAKVVRSLCNCSPIPILIDGKQIDHTLQKSWEHSLYLRPGAADGASVISTLKGNVWTRPHPDQVTLEQIRSASLVWATLEVSSGSWSESRWVIDGVSTAWERNTLDRPGWHVTISADGLSSDLTGLNVVDAPEAVIRRKQICQTFASSPEFTAMPKDNGVRPSDFV